MPVSERPVAASAASESWPKIGADLLTPARDAVPAFPLGLLPSHWRDWIADTARLAGAPPDYVAQAVLGAVSGVCGAGVSARIGATWSEPLVLWQALVGGPSSGKSLALAAGRGLLAPVEAALAANDGRRRERHAARLGLARRHREQWQAECAQAVESGGLPSPMPADAGFDQPFVPARIAVADATPAALGDALRGHPRGAVLWRDGASAWLGDLAGTKRGGLDPDHWLEAWAAGPVTMTLSGTATGPGGVAMGLRFTPVTITVQ